MATASTSVASTSEADMSVASPAKIKKRKSKRSKTYISSKESLIVADYDLCQYAVIYLTNHGRAMAYNKLESMIMEQEPKLFHMLRKNDPSWTLGDVFKTRRETFYDLEFNGCRYISLARNYVFYNARFAKALSGIKDDAKERIIAYKGQEEVLKKYSRDPKRFNEYEFAKCSLALLEILHPVVRSFKIKNNLLFSHIQEKYSNFSHLAKSALNVVDRGTREEVFRKFLRMFLTIFTIEKTLIKLDSSAIDGLMTAIETDLVWSFAGSCVCNGLTSISDLIEKVNELITKAKLRYVTKMTKEHIMQMLKIRRDLYFLPGDGTVWVMDPCTDLPEEILKTIEDFLLDYLSHNSLQYYDCHRVLVREVPILKKVLKDRSFVYIASYLYSLPEVFSFVEGKVILTESPAQVPLFIRMPPVDVPTTLDVDSCWLPVLKAKAFGLVKEVGIRGMIISLDRQYVAKCLGAGQNSCAVVPNVDALCEREYTTVNGKSIISFAELMKKGDFVVFHYRDIRYATIFYPLRLLVVNIISYQTPNLYLPENWKTQLSLDKLTI